MTKQIPTPPHDTNKQDRALSVTRLMTISVIARIVVDTSIQMFNPFLPIIADGLNTNVVTMGRIVGLRSAMGVFSPLFGAAADRRGYRRVLQLGLALGAAGMTTIGLSNNVWTAAIGMVLCGLCFAAFVPTLQAYVSARLPYARRARGLGILEYSWALTGIIGLYLMGQLIEVSGWRVPFFVLGAGMIVMAFVFGRLPSVRDISFEPASESQPDSTASFIQRFRSFFALGDNARSAYSAIAVSSFIMFAAFQFMIIYGAWYFTEYGLTASKLGTVALVFGLFDLVAVVSVSFFTDSIGKWRSVLIGLIGSIAGYILIPIVNTGVVPAILALGIARGFFEFGIVANMPLLSEQVPGQRGKVMTLSAAISLSAVTIASFTGPWLYTLYGIATVAGLSAICTILALLIHIALVKEPNLGL